MMGRPQAPAAAAASASLPASTMQKNVSGRTGLLLDALKEELFQLESDKIQGHVSAAEYTEAKAALDLLIRRAIARQGQAAKV